MALDLSRPSVVIEAQAPSEYRALNQLEAEAAVPEAQASDVRWKQAEEVILLRASGKTHRDIAANWLSGRSGKPVSHVHVLRVERTWNAFGNLSYQDRPQFNEAYNSPEVRKKRAVDERDETPRSATTAQVWNCSALGLSEHIDAGSVDVILTDPPYGAEHLDCWDELASIAAHALKPGGECWAMTGQAHLPQVVNALCGKLDYLWTVAYLTPGGQAVQYWPGKVNAFWKPVLVFSNGPSARDHWIGDVAKSPTNKNESDAHPEGWAQSIGGMRDLLERSVKPGQTVLDPFIGTGTLIHAAHDYGCTVLGADINAELVAQCRSIVA